MMIKLLLVLAVLTPTTGLATHYDADVHEGRLTRSEEPYRASSLTCAVDAALWDELAGEWLLVVADNGNHAVLRVNDTGRLQQAGTFAWSESAGYYVPDSAGLPVVVDVPEETFEKLNPGGETIRVWVWIMSSPR